jgi:XrtJ-associated TM-motif-TM protein
VKKLAIIFPVLLLVLSASVRLHAQITGCDDSPENPTLILGLIVGAASTGYARIRHLRARKSSRR